MRRLLVATTNAGKVAELVPLLHDLGYSPCGLDALGEMPVAVEDGDTFAVNALLKARHYAERTDLPVLADDSGLEVTALGGEPGVHSARFAGEAATDDDNITLLLERMAGVDDRRARFVCSLCLLEPGRPALEVSGSCEGRLLDHRRGDGGFGYDPLFVPDGRPGRTFAELTRDEKRALSHRGRALAALRAALEQRATEA